MPEEGINSSPATKNIFSQKINGFENSDTHLIPVFIWFCLLAWTTRVTVFVRQRAGTEFSSVDVYAGVQILLVFFTLLLIILSSRWQPILSKTARTSVFLLFIYYLLCAVSAIWSPMPTFSLYRAFEFMFLLMGVMTALSYSGDFIKAEKQILFVSTIAIILQMSVNIKLGHSYFSLRMWHTNSYSASAAIVFCYCLGEYFRSEKPRRKTLFKYGLFAFVPLVIGTSAASNVAAFCGIIVILFFYRKFGWFMFCLWLLVVALLLRFVVDVDFSIFREILFPGKTSQGIVTMTGRVGMWEHLFILVQKSPIFGYGFDVLSSGRGVVFANDPHNSIFSILLGTGALGMIPCIVFAYRLLKEFIQTSFRQVPGAIGCASAIITALINSLSMPLVFGEWTTSTLPFACIVSFFILFIVQPYRNQQKDKPALI